MRDFQCFFLYDLSMGLFESITGGFTRGADPFRDAIEDRLREMDIHNARGVGGVFEMPDPARVTERLFQPFQRATVIVADTTPETAMPLLAGELRGGGIGIVSLINLARPGDIRAVDRFEARRMAHQGRERLRIFGMQTGAEFDRVLNP